MIKDKQQTTSEELVSLLEKIKTVVKAKTNEQYIPNIIEFCESEQYLDLSVTLYPMQRIILKCVSGDNYVIDGDTHDRITIKEFCQQNRSSILSFKDNSYEELVKSDVKWCGVSGEKRLFEVTLKNTKHKIQVTEDHQILTHSGYKQLKDITDNDYIVVPNKIPTPSQDTRITDSEIKLLAYFIGDGSCTRWPHFVSNDNELLIREDFTQSVLSYDPSLEFRFRQQSGCNIIRVVKGNCNRNPHLKNTMWEFLQHHGVASKNAHQKRIPAIVYNFSNSQLCLFLSRLFATDGHACLLRNNFTISHAVIGYTTCNNDLAKDVKHLLLRIGILADITHGQVPYEYNGCKSKKDIFQVIIRRSKDVLHFCSQVRIINKETQQKEVEDFCKFTSSYSTTERLPNNIAEKLNRIFKNKRKSRTFYNSEDQVKFDKLYKNKKYNKKYAGYVSDLTADKYAYQISRSCLVYDQIQDIVDVGIHEVYDISVEDTHNFICNDMIIHNCFYRGQPGNEDIDLTEQEIQLLFELKLDSVLEKYYSGVLFRDLVLVLGRRSGKDFMVSLMALYEVMRLLEMPGGSPFKFYNIAEGNPIFILTVAMSSDQARILFTEIAQKMTSSVYFRDKIGHMEADKISLLTPQDVEKQKQLLKNGLDNAASKIKGSVVIMSGHSNSESLLGKRIYALLLDEVASFKTTGLKTSGDRIYSALAPATADFVRKTGKFDEEGNEIIVLDSKIISISSPRSEEGMLFKLYNDTPNTPTRLAFKLPTWKVSKQWPESMLRQEFKFMSANDFNMEFGAEFSGTAGEKFIPDHYIDEALEIGAELNLAQSNGGLPGIIYYAHLDPAATSHNYALVVLHVEERMRLAEKNGQIIKEKTKMFIVDHLKCWQPVGGTSINVHEVDEYVADLARRFRFAMVSYDNWNSQSSVQMLRRKGIPTKITPFRREYKMKIYDHLEHLLVNHQLAIPRKTPFSQMVEMELKCLKRIYLPTGFKIEPNPDAQITTDDFADALAGACGLASESMYTGYPQGALVSMPQMPSLGSNTQWRIGNATISDQQWRLWNRKFGI